MAGVESGFSSGNATTQNAGAVSVSSRCETAPDESDGIKTLSERSSSRLMPGLHIRTGNFNNLKMPKKM
jgi:hypothetical protein